MGIADLPESYEAFERFNLDYERQHFRYTDANRRVAAATMDMFAGWFPRLLAPLVRPAICALLDEPVIRAFGFSRPSRMVHWLEPALPRARARMVRWLPARRRPSACAPEMTQPSYPAGYVIEKLGPKDAA